MGLGKLLNPLKTIKRSVNMATNVIKNPLDIKGHAKAALKPSGKLNKPASGSMNKPAPLSTADDMAPQSRTPLPGKRPRFKQER